MCFKGMKDKRTGTVLCETFFTPRNLQFSMVVMMQRSGTSEFHYWHLQLGGAPSMLNLQGFFLLKEDFIVTVASSNVRLIVSVKHIETRMNVTAAT